MSRTIEMEMNWKTAAEIYMAALEGGTGEGWKAARAEIRRMAEMLDAMREQEAEPAKAAPAGEATGDSVELVEVIAHHPDDESNAFGMTFHAVTTAMAYARHMRRAGYRADVSPAFYTEPTTEAALESAARFFEDQAIKEARP